jgi:H+/Cl- antiporter ClcA
MDFRRRTLFAQGVYYTVTGVVPFVSRDAFEAVTGPKREWWLVQTVAALVTAVGGGLLGASVRDRATPELRDWRAFDPASPALRRAGALAASGIVPGR